MIVLVTLFWHNVMPFDWTKRIHTNCIHEWYGTISSFQYVLPLFLGMKRYEIQEYLGQGAYAKVYKAREEIEDTQHSCDDIDESVVIKVCSKKL